MSQKCIIKNCPNRQQPCSSPDLHFYRLPTDFEVRSKWDKFIRAQNGFDFVVRPSSRVCSNHFNRSDIGKRKLVSKAIPCIAGIIGGSLIDDDGSESAVNRLDEGCKQVTSEDALCFVENYNAQQVTQFAASHVRSGQTNLKIPFLAKDDNVVTSDDLFDVCSVDCSEKDKEVFQLFVNQTENQSRSVCDLDDSYHRPAEADEVASKVVAPSVGKYETKQVIEVMVPIGISKQTNLNLQSIFVNNHDVNSDDFSAICFVDCSEIDVDISDVFVNQTDNPVNLCDTDILCQRTAEADECLGKEFETTTNGICSPEKRLQKCHFMKTNVEQIKRCFATKHCSVFKCESNNISKAMHSFPSIYKKNADGIKIVDATKLARCRQWVKNSGNHLLLSQHPGSLMYKFYICQDHFQVSDMNSKMNKVLKRNAVPTLFSSSDGISDELMSVYDSQWNIPTETYLIDQIIDMVSEIPDKNNGNNSSSEHKNYFAENSVEEVMKEKEHAGSLKNKNDRKKCCFINCSAAMRKFSFPIVLSKNNGDTIIDPLQVERCIEWIERSGNVDLLRVTPPNLHKVAFVCGSHFNDDQFVYRRKCQLKDTAVPNSDSNCIEKEKMSNYIRYFNFVPGMNSEEYLKSCNDIESALSFEKDMMSLNWFVCSNCKEKQLKTRTDKHLCSNHKKCDELSDRNNMDPGIVPIELQGLTFIEEQLISRVHPLVSVHRLKKGQFGYSGNIISFPQDITEFAKQLPVRVKDLSSVVKVVFENESGRFHEFRIRSKKVHEALKWLVKNNIFYKDVNISQENLASLPEDENVSEEIQSIIASSENDENSARVETEEKRIHHSGVPSDCFAHPDDQINAALNWPKLGREPINELKTKGYIACAFPTLFPYGYADLRDVRPKSVSPSRYFKHLMKYHDNRFAQHSTFRFFAMNSLMRWTALTDGSVMVQNCEEFKNMTNGRLKELLKDNPNLIKRIIFRASNLRGSKPYWKSRCNELKEMIEQIGLPTIFLTLSYADHHYNDLFRLLTNKNVVELTEKERNELLQDNPMVVDQYFTARVDAFIEKVLKPRFNVIDFWYRIEYQHRGAPHLHGLFWFDGAPDMSKYDTFDDEAKCTAKEYFDNLITAMNPDESSDVPNTHPCRKSFEESLNNNEDLAQLLNTVQRHSVCSTSYCLKYNKKTKKTQCRFNFPIPVEAESHFELCEKGRLEFVPQRNDSYLNKYNKFMSQVWRANIDIAPVTSKEALIAYLVKYISKSEVASLGMDDVLQTILLSGDDNNNVKNAIQRLFIKVCAERDFSAQEVCRIMMGEKLFSSGGRLFVHLNLSSKNEWIPLDEDREDGQPKKQKTSLDKYVTRPEELENLSLWQAVTLYNMKTWKKVKRKNIALIFPKYKAPKEDTKESGEKYFRQEELLHVPWREENAFINNYSSWEETYKDNQQHVGSPVVLDLNVEIEKNNEEDDEDCEDQGFETLPLQEWQLLSSLGPKTNISDIELGSRDIDLNHNWQDIPAKYVQYGHVKEMKTFIKTKKKEQDVTEIVSPRYNEFPDVIFNEEQQKVVDIVDKLVKNLKNDENLEMCCQRILVQGKAGSGKSLLIKYIQSRISKELGTDVFMTIAPTGIAALQIDGETIHRALHIKGSDSEFKPLNEEKLRKLCNKMENVKFLILDEYSMVGCGMLAKIDQRCKQAKNNFKEHFGGLHVFFLGDICQLPPVSDVPVYSKNIKSRLKVYGKKVFESFNKVVVLKQSHRQQSNAFEHILDNVSKGILSNEDFECLKKRFENELSQEEKNDFLNTLRIFPTRQEVQDYNMEKLRNLIDETTGDNCPVAKIPAFNNCKEAAMGSSDDAEGLSNVIYLAKGCKVMLTNNLWTCKGLANGVIGNVVDILYDTDQNPPDSSPSVILCDFKSYIGPQFIPNSTIVPIYSIPKYWEAENGVKCKRSQFPLQTCYACSIHKSQGMTLSKVVIDLGDREFALGLTYVGLSRVKSIDGLMLQKFDVTRVTKLQEYPTMKLRLLFEQHLQELASRPMDSIGVN